MEVGKKQVKSKEVIEVYMDQINWDGLFFKGQLIIGSILIIGMTFFLLWYTQ